MKAELHLSRPCYRAGTPVIGTVRIHRDLRAASASSTNVDIDNHSQSRRPIRDEIISARVYLSGRAYIGGGSGKVSRWRSMQEINQLKNMYGDHHACLTMAVDDERCNWNGAWKTGGVGICDERAKMVTGSRDTHESIGIEKASRSKHSGKLVNAALHKKTPSPSLYHVEQAERLAVYSCLHHNSSAMTIHDGNGGNGYVSNDSNVLKNSLSGGNDYSNLPSPHDSNVICFWMTNVLELLDIPERHLDRNSDNNCKLRTGRGRYYGDMHPYRPLQIPNSTVLRDVWHEIEDRGKINSKEANKKSSSLMKRRKENSALLPHSAWDQIVASANPRKEASKDDELSLEHFQFVATFRADIPSNAPPTMTTECIKYFYSAVLVVTTANGELLIDHCQFTVLTSNLHPTHKTSPTRVHIGDLYAIAHSVALPTYISSTEVSDANPPQLNVVSNSPACDIVSRRTAEQRTSTNRIQDSDGCYCASMTLIGIGQGPLVPGTRLGIRFQFPICEGDECSDGTGIIPCHRVCCAVVGEEYAIEGSSTTNGCSKKRVKTRSYVFDSAYDLVHFGYTEAISLGLILPLDCPVTVKTDLVEVTVTLMVEFTVGSTTIGACDKEIQSGDQGEFKVIRLDLPCEVIHGSEGLSSLENRDEEGERHVSSRRTMRQFWNHYDTETYVEGLDDIDIQPDLKLLSLRLKECI